MLESSAKSLRRGALALLIFGSATSCQDLRDSGSAQSSEASRGPDRGEDISDSESGSATALSDLFRDDLAFSLPEITGGRTNCEDVTARPDIKSDLVAWPSELKTFLVEQLKLMPIKKQILDSVFAIYLVKEAVLSDENGPSAAGLACDRGTDYKGIIFLNADTFVASRKEAGIGRWQDLRAIQDRYVLLESGDNAALTLVHEVLHAIDNKIYINGLDPDLKARRTEVFGLSWADQTEPKYDRITLLSLTDGGEPKPQSGCRTRLRGVASPLPPATLGLASAKSDVYASDLKFLADKTNFIVPYATVTAAEDFAESLTLYYFGTYRGSWQTRTVYEGDIKAKGLSDNEVLYVARTQDIMKKNTLQRDKMCQMAELVFSSCKL